MAFPWQTPQHETNRKSQLSQRIPAPLVRHLLEEFRSGRLPAQPAAHELGLCRARFYELYSEYLAACAQGQGATWTPKPSGGAHHPRWPTAVEALLLKLLSSKPPSNYSATASELQRRLQFKTDRASVRRWALAHGLAPDTRYKARPKPVKRWQVQALGALWQYDASPHPWLPQTEAKQVLLNLLDDATRLNAGARLYPRENLLAHLDFLERTFRAHGLPLALYVDYHSFFYTHNPEAFTQLGQALHFYGVALRFAPTPQAKGKVERRHDYWQKRLPALLAADQIHRLGEANQLLAALTQHANEHEVHRELGMTPAAAVTQARQEKRSVLRPAPACPWWPYVWSQQTRVRIDEEGRVAVGHQRLSIDAPPRSWVTRCQRHDGDLFFLRQPPSPNLLPVVLLHCPPF